MTSMKNLTENTASPNGNPRAASVRIGGLTVRKSAGQINHDLRRGPQPKYVAQDRTELNRVLRPYAKPAELREICQERRDQRETQRRMRTDAAVMTTGVITFGSEAAQAFEKLPVEMQDAAFEDLAQAIADRLSTSLHGLVVHLDEATIHAHYQLAAVNTFGNPISKTTSPRVMSELQDLTAEIMGKYCPEIERGTRYGDRLAAGADFADVVHKSVAQLHRELPRDIERKRAQLAELELAETEARARMIEMQGRVDKLREKGELTAKEVKRLQTYEQRLTDRVADFEAAERASQAIRAEQERLAGLAAEDRRRDEEAAAQAREDRQADEAASRAVIAEAETARAVIERAEAMGVAVEALAVETANETIYRRDGKIVMADPSKVKLAMPEIRPAVVAAADHGDRVRTHRAQVEADRGEIATDRAGIAAAWQEIERERGLIAAGLDALRGLQAQVVGWIRRVAPLERDAEIQTETADAVRRAFPQAHGFAKRIKETFQAMARVETPGSYEGQLGAMQRQQDRELLDRVKAEMRHEDSPAQEPRPEPRPRPRDVFAPVRDDLDGPSR
jgi:hypothetical protein